MEKKWYVRVGDRTVGPATSREVLAGVEDGTIHSTHLVRRDGEDEWREIGATPELVGDGHLAAAAGSRRGRASFRIVGGIGALLVGLAWAVCFWWGTGLANGAEFKADLSMGDLGTLALLGIVVPIVFVIAGITAALIGRDRLREGKGGNHDSAVLFAGLVSIAAVVVVSLVWGSALFYGAGEAFRKPEVDIIVERLARYRLCADGEPSPTPIRLEYEVGRASPFLGGFECEACLAERDGCARWLHECQACAEYRSGYPDWNDGNDGPK